MPEATRSQHLKPRRTVRTCGVAESRRCVLSNHRRAVRVTVPQAGTHTAMAQDAHPTSNCYALLMRSAALLLHDHMKVEDIPIWITHVEGAMTPGLGR